MHLGNTSYVAELNEKLSSTYVFKDLIKIIFEFGYVTNMKEKHTKN